MPFYMHLQWFKVRKRTLSFCKSWPKDHQSAFWICTFDTWSFPQYVWKYVTERIVPLQPGKAYLQNEEVTAFGCNVCSAGYAPTASSNSDITTCFVSFCLNVLRLTHRHSVFFVFSFLIVCRAVTRRNRRKRRGGCCGLIFGTWTKILNWPTWSTTFFNQVC